MSTNEDALTDLEIVQDLMDDYGVTLTDTLEDLMEAIRESNEMVGEED